MYIICKFIGIISNFILTLLVFTLRSGSPAMEAGVANHVWELEEIVDLADWNLPSPKALGVGRASWDEARPPSHGRLVVGQAGQ